MFKNDSERKMRRYWFLCVVYISSVYSLFSDGVGLPLHTIPSPGVLMIMSIGAVNHMRGMQYHIVINITLWQRLN